MLVTKAPGKVILFGEHAVVYGHAAIAASVDLHTYIFVGDGPADHITLDFPMVKLAQTWKTSEIPYTEGTEIGTKLDESVVDALQPLLDGITDSFARASAFAFLYLYSHICTANTPGKVYSARSTLPVGAGLGSSASFSVALAAALLETSPAPVGRETINKWAFLGESCIHGNPSGIDNVVASRGGAVRFVKGVSIEPITMPAIDLVLTNTRVPRRTAELVAGVGARRTRFPHIMDPLLTAIGTLSNTVYESIKTANPATLAQELSELACINHGLLVALGVSHPSLEKVRNSSKVTGLGETKLTGAGGGGCAITISTDMTNIDEFKQLVPGMEVFSTKIGGNGVARAVMPESTIPTDPTSISGWNYYSE